jgi:hypothetical protein
MVIGEVDNRVSIRIADKVLARWGKQDGQYQIILNLAGCWSEAKEIIDRSRPRPLFDGDAGSPWNVDDYIDAFYDSLSCSYLIERICIERNNQRIRLKRDHCKPCCIQDIMIAMHNHVHNVFTYTALSEEDRTIREESPGDFTKRSKD